MTCNKQCQDDILMMADSAAGAFTFITWSVALFQIGKHLKHYTNSYFQNKIISSIFLINLFDSSSSYYFHGTILCFDILFDTLFPGNPKIPLKILPTNVHF